MLTLQRIHIQGNGPPPSYEAKVTVLEDCEDVTEAEGDSTLQVLVTGGYLQGGCGLRS